ncbi:MAG: beta-1,6-N-acetylglucosaminyltransferase, partial [Pseudomonadota bacterium]
MQLGFIVLAHQDLHRTAELVRHLAQEAAAVAVHIDAKVRRDAYDAVRADLGDLENVVFSRRTPCEWGRFSLVQATNDAAEALLNLAPDLDHVMLCSGSCLPVRPIRQLRRFLARNRGVDLIESVSVAGNIWVKGGLNEERFTLYFPFSWRKQRRLFDRFVTLQRRLGIERKIP